MFIRDSTLFSCIVLCLIRGNVIAQEQPALSSIIPKINQENFQLAPEGNGYSLKITLEDGSERDENVEIKNSGTSDQYLAVKGTSNLIFPEGTATTYYTADKKGYSVKYKYEMIDSEFITLSLGSLKAAAG